MAHIALTGTVERIEVREDALMGAASDVVLRGVTDGNGTALPDGLRVNHTGQMRRLDLTTGDRIALGGQHLDAYDGTNRCATGIADAAAFLQSLPAERRATVALRLVRPSGVHRLPIELAPAPEQTEAAPEG
jgi:hypothetical protein